MDDCIERENVSEVLCRLAAETDDANESEYSDSFLDGYRAALAIAEIRINDIPAADVRPERHGQWSKTMVAVKEEAAGYHNDDVRFGFQCLECGAVLNKTKYCGNCGAKMDEEDGESNG